MRLGTVRLASVQARLGALGSNPNAPIAGIEADVVILVQPDVDTILVAPDVSTIRVQP